jgi:hypothetical protein
MNAGWIAGCRRKWLGRETPRQGQDSRANHDGAGDPNDGCRALAHVVRPIARNASAEDPPIARSSGVPEIGTAGGEGRSGENGDSALIQCSPAARLAEARWPGWRGWWFRASPITSPSARADRRFRGLSRRRRRRRAHRGPTAIAHDGKAGGRRGLDREPGSGRRAGAGASEARKKAGGKRGRPAGGPI